MPKRCEKCTVNLYKNKCVNRKCSEYDRRLGESVSYLYPEQLRCPLCGEFVSFKTCFCATCNRYLGGDSKRDMKGIDLCKKCHLWSCNGYTCTGKYDGGDYTSIDTD